MSHAPITDEDLDRLADGELSPSEERELLRALNASPEDWRRCALAMVEAQTLRRELGVLASPATATVEVAKRPARTGERSPAGWLTIAALLLVAFGVGTVARHAWSPTPPAGDSLVAHPTTLPSEEPAPPVEALADTPQQRPDSPNSDVVTFWAHDEQGRRSSLRTQLVDAEELDKQLGVEFRSALPADVRQRLEDRGYRFESRRRYAPLNMDDGRTLVVPVEDMQVAPMPLKYL